MQRRPRPAAVAAALAAVLTITLAGGVGAHADTTASSVLGWTQRVTTGTGAAFVVDETTAVDGAVSLRIDNTTARAPERYAELNQDVAVEPGATYELSGWFRGADLPESAAVLVTSNDWVQRIPLPHGTFDWQQVTWEVTIPAGESVRTWRLLLEDTGSLWLDDLRMVEQGTTANLLANGSFEDFTDGPGSATLAIAATSLVFETGTGQVPVRSTSPELAYRVVDVDGVLVDHGVVTTTEGEAVVDVTGLAQGYYGIELESTGVDAVSLTTSFAVVDDLAASARGPESAFGLSFHPDEFATTEQLLADVVPLGTSHARVDYLWEQIETAPGQYTFPVELDSRIQAMIDAGIRPLVIINYRNALYDDGRTPSTPEGLAAYGRYAAAVAEHFGTSVDYEIYNEFNHHFNDGLCGRTPECYYDLAAAASPQIRSVVPDAVIAGPAIAGSDIAWMTRFAELGGLEYLDALSFHPYNHPDTPDEHQPERIEQARQIIADYAEPGHDVQLWITEVGWPTPAGYVSEEQQAQYITRYAAGSIAAGADRTYWYEINDAGTDNSDLEQHFGMMRHTSDAVPAYAPKPGYLAYTTAVRYLADASAAGRDNLADGSFSYRFEGGSAGDVRVLWATTPADVTVTASGPLTLVDLYGRISELTPADGELVLSLTERPVYVLGDVSSVQAAPETVYDVIGPDVLDLDTPIGLQVSVDHSGHAAPVDGPVTFRASTGERVLVPARAGERTTATLTIPATGSPGVRDITVDVIVGGEVVMQRHLLTTVADHRVSYRIEPRPTSLEPVEGSVALTLTNASLESELTVTDVSWDVEGLQVAGETTTSVDVGGSTTLTAPLTGAQLWQRYPYEITLTYADGVIRTLSGTVGLNPVLPEAAGTDLVIDLAQFGTEVELTEPSTGAADLSGTIGLTSNETGLVVTASVVDDVHDNDQPASEMWRADSIQMAFSPQLPEQSGSFVEVGASLGTEGASAWRFSGGTGQFDAVADVRRDEDAGRTEYRVELPWESIGVSPDAETFGFSILVNDADGDGRTGFLEWGSGIGITKDPTQFNAMRRWEASTAPVADTWDSSVAYDAGAEVEFEGRHYLAAWWTQGAEPGQSVHGAWQEIATADDGLALWTPSRIFVAGDHAWFDDTLYEARWWTRAEQPDDGGAWAAID